MPELQNSLPAKAALRNVEGDREATVRKNQVVRRMRYVNGINCVKTRTTYSQVNGKQTSTTNVATDSQRAKRERLGTTMA